MVPIVPDQYFWLIGCISAKQSGTWGQSRAITKVWRNRLSPTRVGCRKSNQLLFLNMFKNSSRSKPVGRWSSWSSEGLQKVALSRLSCFRVPSGALFHPRELRIPSAALCRGSCEGCHKESLVTKYNSKIWFYICSKSLRIIIDLKINTNTREYKPI